MEENKNINKELYPSGQISQMRLLRFSNIFSNMSLSFGVILILILLSSVLLPILKGITVIICFLLVFIMVVVTFGLILTISGNPATSLWRFLNKVNNDETMLSVVKFEESLIPYVGLFTVAMSIIAIVLLSYNKVNKKRTSKLVITSLVLAFASVLVIVYFAKGGNLWQN